MSKDLFNVSTYLERINYQGKTDVSYETLHGLHTAHTLNVPFENLDVFDRKPILLDRESLYKKIVENNRGGYCFEMNGLFSAILKELGFKVRDLLARVTNDGKTYLARTHQILMVEIDNKRWLADVGFGSNGIIAPLLLEEDIDQYQFNQCYRLLKDSKLGYVLQHKEENKYGNMYAFTLDECYPADYIMCNYFTSTFPESLFLHKKLCTMPIRTGRITLTDEHFKVVEKDHVSEIEISSDAEFNELLQKYFGLDLNYLE